MAIQKPSVLKASDLKININPNNYQTKIPSLTSVQKEYGLQDPAKYADSIANKNAQSKLDGINAQRTQVDQDLREGQMSMDVDFFNQFRQQKESQAQRGLNSGIQAQQDTQLDMNRQSVLGNLYRDANRQKDNLNTDARRVEVEKQAEALQIRHTELQSQIDLAFRKGDFLQAENSRRMQLDVEKEKSRIDGLKTTNDRQWDNYYKAQDKAFQDQTFAFNKKMAEIDNRMAERDYAFKVKQASIDNAYRNSQASYQRSQDAYNRQASANAEASARNSAVAKLVNNSSAAARSAKSKNDINKVMGALMSANADGLLTGKAYTSAVNKASAAYTDSAYYKSWSKKKK